MCFSPQADLVGGVVITVIGVDAVRHVRQRRELIALASIPLLLGAHQFIEALTWLWLQGHVSRGIGQFALWAYLLIAFVVLPIYIPLAIIALEPTRRRKLLMTPFAALGAATATVLFAAMIRGPVGVRLAPYHLAYSIRLHDGFLDHRCVRCRRVWPAAAIGLPPRCCFRHRQPRRRHRHRPPHRLRVRLRVVWMGGLVQWRHRAALPVCPALSPSRPAQG